MIKDDYLLKMIEQISSMLASIMFNKDIKEIETEIKEDEIHNDELNLIVKRVQCNQYDQLINEFMLDECKLKLCLIFFNELNNYSDKELISIGLTRNKLKDDLIAILEKYGYSHIIDLFDY